MLRYLKILKAGIERKSASRILCDGHKQLRFVKKLDKNSDHVPCHGILARIKRVHAIRWSLRDVRT